MAALASYEILDTAPDPRIDVFVRVAAQFYDVPISLVTLVDERRVWFKASVGDVGADAPREVAFCAHAIMTPDDVMVVEDTTRDPRFSGNVLVTSPPDIRFYAGAPILSFDGLPLGTLCILDRKARRLDEPGRLRLADLARGVGAALDLHRTMRQLTLAATHDPLTGLANRALFDPALEQAMLHSTAGVPCSLFLLDLDRFKAINDQFGHAVGDDVLREAARRLRAASRETDLPARLGGDEFALLVRGPLDPGGPGAVAARILAAFAEPLAIDGMALSLHTSIGYAVAPRDAENGADLMRCADRALYRAKDAGRGVAAGAGDVAEPDGPHASALMRDLEHAVATEAFTLAWQPYFETQTGRIAGCEALIRWDRPGHGETSPSVFVPLAEAEGLMTRIDQWVLQAACAAAAAWPLDVDVSVNVTAATFCQRNYSRHVKEALLRSRLAPGRLVLEVTERMAVDNPAAARRCIGELHAAGVRVALDDFGIGFSALASLKEFAFDKLKLDRSFIRDIGRDRRAEAVTRAVIQLGHATGMTVCAEGVETPEQLGFLQDQGCELAQGFLLGRPAAAACLADVSTDPEDIACDPPAEAPKRRGAGPVRERVRWGAAES